MGILTLNRSEIIRGFDIFEDILKDGEKLNSGNLSAFVTKNENVSGFTVQIGLILSKKNFKNLMIGTV